MQYILTEEEFEYAMCNCGYAVEHCGDGHEEHCHFHIWKKNGADFKPY